MNKRQLYESIMRNVSREVKQTLNEDDNGLIVSKWQNKHNNELSDNSNVELNKKNVILDKYRSDNFLKNLKYFKIDNEYIWAITYGYMGSDIVNLVIKKIKIDMSDYNKVIIDGSYDDKKNYINNIIKNGRNYELIQQYILLINTKNKTAENNNYGTWHSNDYFVRPYIDNIDAAKYVANMVKHFVKDVNNPLCKYEYYMKSFAYVRIYDENRIEKCRDMNIDFLRTDSDHAYVATENIWRQQYKNKLSDKFGLKDAECAYRILLNLNTLYGVKAGTKLFDKIINKVTDINGTFSEDGYKLCDEINKKYKINESENKRQLYESIMRNVSDKVKLALNENEINNPDDIKTITKNEYRQLLQWISELQCSVNGIYSELGHDGSYYDDPFIKNIIETDDYIEELVNK